VENSVEYTQEASKNHTILVYTKTVKNITLSADEHLIEEARRAAQAQHTTLNAAFREWLADYSARQGRMQEYDALMERLNYVKVDRKYTRDEMNER
jgi:cbb3-type cytochrome oxidase cytochrome c subunit